MAASFTRLRRRPTYRIGKVRAHLRRHGVIAYATESCFGFGCDPRDVRAIEKILHLKRRPWHKGLITVAAKFEQAASLVLPLEEDARRFTAQHWPGPYTFLLPRSRKAPPRLVGRHHSLALRVSAHPDIQTLCRDLRMALVSTSANIAGHRPVKSYRAALRQFGHHAMVLPGRIGQRKQPSTIIDLISRKILRG